MRAAQDAVARLVSMPDTQEAHSDGVYALVDFRRQHPGHDDALVRAVLEAPWSDPRSANIEAAWRLVVERVMCDAPEAIRAHADRFQQIFDQATYGDHLALAMPLALPLLGPRAALALARRSLAVGGIDTTEVALMARLPHIWTDAVCRERIVGLALNHGPLTEQLVRAHPTDGPLLRVLLMSWAGRVDPNRSWNLLVAHCASTGLAPLTRADIQALSTHPNQAVRMAVFQGAGTLVHDDDPHSHRQSPVPHR